MHLFLDGILGDRGHLWQDKFSCPFMLCPSNQPIDGAKPARMKFVQKVAPRVFQYRCRWCGCLLNKSMDGPAVPEDMWAQHINPKLVSNKPSYSLRKW